MCLLSFPKAVVICWLVVTFTHSTVASICMHYLNPLDPSVRTVDTCPDTTNRPSDHSVALIETDSFVYDYACSEFNVDPARCAAVMASFEHARDILTSAMRITNSIEVHVQFIPFCTKLGVCPQSNVVILGKARPATTHLMVDVSDNHTREYPQALLKQMMSLGQHPSYNGSDIIAWFNADVFWDFDMQLSSGHSNPQAVFLPVVLHELIHGLGFISGYSNEMFASFQRFIPNLSLFLTPTRYIPPNVNPKYVIAPSLTDPQGFWGFTENAFDKYLYYGLKDGSQLSFSQLTSELNTFNGGNTIFPSGIEFMVTWLQSTQIQAATVLGQAAVTPNAIHFRINATTNAILYTSTNYVDGTSISHFDYTYGSTADYLMLPSQRMNNATEPSDTASLYKPFLGPLLLDVLSTLGYPLYTTNYTFTPPVLEIYNPPANVVGSS